MPQDPNLYGQPPPKRQKKEMAMSSSLSFSSQLSSLLASKTTTPSSSSTPVRPTARPSKTDDLFGVKPKKKRKADTVATDRHNDGDSNKLRLKSPQGTDDDKAERLAARRRREHKARLYAAMKRGDYIAREGEAAPLVDFDRKWAERHRDGRGSGDDNDGDSNGDNDDDDDDDEDNNDTEVVEWEDEFGRLRRGTRAEKLRTERRAARGVAGAAELERMSARPRAPENVIVGDTVQTAAFKPEDDVAARMADLAARRDRSATPPEPGHYDAAREIRTRGVGFFRFSRDEGARSAEMANLEAERAATEAARREREDRLAARRREIEERRREIGARRAKKLADSFLDGLAVDMSPAPGAGREEKEEASH